jgi:predicted Zn-dependent peptidase
MERLQSQFEYRFLSDLQSLQSRATLLNHYSAYTGHVDYIDDDLARYRQATAEALSQQAAAWLSADKAGAVIVVPEPESAATAGVTP